jgi:hypothetical protein
MMAFSLRLLLSGLVFLASFPPALAETGQTPDPGRPSDEARTPAASATVPENLSASGSSQPATGPARLDLRRYRDFLTRQPDIKTAIGLEDLQHWKFLGFALEGLDRDGRLPGMSPLPSGRIPDSYRRRLHLRKAALQLWLEVNRKLPWSVLTLRTEDRQALFGYEATFHRHTSRQLLTFLIDLDEAFLRQAWLQKTRLLTIEAMGSWIRANLQHGSSTDPEPSSWQQMAEGGSYGSCHNVGDFLAVASLALNIPVRTDYYTQAAEWSQHRYLDFPSEDRLVLHGDDFYNSSFSGLPPSGLFASGSVRADVLARADSEGDGLAVVIYRESVARNVRAPSADLLAASCTGGEAIVEVVERGHTRGGQPDPWVLAHRAETVSVLAPSLAALREEAARQSLCPPGPPGFRFVAPDD